MYLSLEDTENNTYNYFNDLTHTNITVGTVLINKVYNFFHNSLGRFEARDVIYLGHFGFGDSLWLGCFEAWDVLYLERFMVGTF
jgi:hypothetical protein